MNTNNLNQLDGTMAIYLKTEENLANDQILWRYMDLAKFVSMLESNALWLARADSFPDKHEGKFPDEMRKLIEKAYEVGFKNTDPSPVNNAEDFQDYLVKNTFISCWHKNSDENMVMWQIYGKDINALAVQTSVGDIAMHIDSSNLNGYSLNLKSVDYNNSHEITGEVRYEDCFFRKRKHFSFEKEVRISLDTYDRRSPSKQTPNGYYLPVATNNIIKNIFVHPDCPKWYLDVVVAVKKKYNLIAAVQRGLYGSL